MKFRKLVSVLCAAAVVMTSAGGLPFGSARLFDTAIKASAAGTVTDTLTVEDTGRSGSTYGDWTYTSEVTGVSYKGQSAAGNYSIQIRSNNNNSGIVSTSSDKKVKSVSVAWNSNTSDGRTLNVYGSNTAYTSPSDLYDSANLIGTIVNGTSTDLTVTGDYKYIGIRSSSGALYLDSFSIEYEDDTPQPPDPALAAGVIYNIGDTINVANDSYMCMYSELTDYWYVFKGNYVLKTPTYDTSYSQFRFNEQFTGKIGNAVLTWTMFLGKTQGVTGNETVKGIKCISGDGTESSPYKFELVLEQLTDPTYTVTIPATVDLGGAPATVSIDSMENIPSGQSVRVTIDGDADGNFTVEQADDKLSYTITGTRPSSYYAEPDDTTQLDIEDDMEILHVDGPDDMENPRYIELKFNKPDQEPRYAGDYTGTVTFIVSIS